MSILRELTDEEVFKKEPAKALLEAALLVRRAGLEHLVTTATRSEALALAHAGEILGHEQGVGLSNAIRDPAFSLKRIDGGRALRRQVMREALAEAGRSG